MYTKCPNCDCSILFQSKKVEQITQSPQTKSLEQFIKHNFNINITPNNSEIPFYSYKQLYDLYPNSHIVDYEIFKEIIKEVVPHKPTRGYCPLTKSSNMSGFKLKPKQ